MNINDAFPSKYLTAADLPEEGSKVVTVEKIGLEEVGRDKETKPIIYFAEFNKALVLNVTNARTIARALGSEDFDDWIGQRIALYRTEVQYGGDMVEGIRVKLKSPPSKPAPATKPLNKPVVVTRERPVTEPDDDEVPF